MADAADENGEPEVAECLRFLWKHRQVPKASIHNSIWHWGHWTISPCTAYWNEMPEQVGRDTSPVKALDRVVETWPRHKQLLIDALEPVCTT